MAAEAIVLTDAKTKALLPPSSGQMQFIDRTVPGLRVRIGGFGCEVVRATQAHRGQISQHNARSILRRADARRRPLLTTQADDLLQLGADRPAITLEEGDNGTGPVLYRITDDPDRWVEDVRPGPVLLHVDMDCFNNRYDGDGDWRGRSEVLDPAMTDVLAEVDQVTATMRRAGLVPCIEDAVIHCHQLRLRAIDVRQCP